MNKQIVYLTTSQLAERLQVDASTIRKWVSKGQLVPAVTTIGGHHRFDEETLPENLQHSVST